MPISCFEGAGCSFAMLPDAFRQCTISLPIFHSAIINRWAEKFPNPYNNLKAFQNLFPTGSENIFQISSSGHLSEGARAFGPCAVAAGLVDFY